MKFHTVHVKINGHTFNIRIFSLWRELFRRLQLYLWSKVPSSESNKIVPNLLLWWWVSPTTKSVRQSSSVSWMVVSQILYFWALGRRSFVIFSKENEHFIKMQKWRIRPCQGQINSAADKLPYICDLHQVNQYGNMPKILIFGNMLILFANKSISAYMRLFLVIFRIQELNSNSLNYVLKTNRQNTFLAIFFQSTTVGCQHAMPFLLLEYDIESYKALSNNIAFKTKIPGQQGHTQS